MPEQRIKGLKEKWKLKDEEWRMKGEKCPREPNGVAHELALAARFSFCNEWLDVAPNALLLLILKDVNVITCE